MSIHLHLVSPKNLLYYHSVSVSKEFLAVYPTSYADLRQFISTLLHKWPCRCKNVILLLTWSKFWMILYYSWDKIEILFNKLQDPGPTTCFPLSSHTFPTPPQHVSLSNCMTLSRLHISRSFRFMSFAMLLHPLEIPSLISSPDKALSQDELQNLQGPM